MDAFDKANLSQTQHMQQQQQSQTQHTTQIKQYQDQMLQLQQKMVQLQQSHQQQMLQLQQQQHILTQQQQDRNERKDKHYIFAMAYSEQLKTMDSEQLLNCHRIIQDALYLGNKKRLSDDSKIMLG